LRLFVSCQKEGTRRYPQNRPYLPLAGYTIKWGIPRQIEEGFMSIVPFEPVLCLIRSFKTYWAFVKKRLPPKILINIEKIEIKIIERNRNSTV
jgi:hypothetical protein